MKMLKRKTGEMKMFKKKTQNGAGKGAWNAARACSQSTATQSPSQPGTLNKRL